ncbi:MAG: RagB/SusD family nutrient uptake outer membrane protein [Bacteroidaceae bacterium]|nr:RagB/SusD family nutrient uptake outer membrane protein [Bacteroidaceae bacterium]
MKKPYNFIKTALLLGLAAWTMASCQDWLTLYPTSQIVEENFWEDKNDLEGVRYSVYQQMRHNLDKLVLWGDLRAVDTYNLYDQDQTKKSDGPTFWQDLQEARLERDSTNTYFQWQGFYTAINYCNKILYHGPSILERDKQFTTSEWLQMKAEVTALRALNYFYLIRAFKDVPYTTKVINKSGDVELFGVTNQLDILDSLIVDVESNCLTGKQGTALARNRFGKMADTKGIFTNPAIYALLSDMYLWRASLHQGRWDDLNKERTFTITNVPAKYGTTETTSPTEDYRACIAYGKLALAALKEQNDNGNISSGGSFSSTLASTVNYGLGEDCNMYANDFSNFKGGSTPSLDAYTQIFMQQNSQESIFELQFSESDKFKNEVVTGFYGYGEKVHLEINKNALYKNLDHDFYCDSRSWFSAWNNHSTDPSNSGDFFCFKWCSITMFDNNTSNNTSHECSKLRILNDGASAYNNWIIYRMTDVMLQIAEAHAILGEKTEALKYVNAIHRRWYCNDQSQEQPSAIGTLGNAPWGTDAEDAVLKERQMEFIGEGKRWFDLVRYAERHAGGLDETGTNNPDPREWTEETPFSNGKAGVEKMIEKYLSVGSIGLENPLKSRIQNRYGLYNLIYYMEIKASKGNLQQNPVWNKTQYEL